MKTILITGVSGFIGLNLAKRFSKYFQIVGLDLKDNNEKALIRFYCGDINDTDLLKRIFSENKIDIVIHSAASKSLAWCEKNRDEAHKNNFLATKAIYQISKEKGSKFIFISSDQVFDGKEGNYNENSVKHPINHYGTLKDISEDLLIGDSKCVICRTAMVFERIPGNLKKEFDDVKNEEKLKIQGYIIDHVIFRLSNKKKIYLPADEFCSPTSNTLLFTQINMIIKKDLSGIYHCCGGEKISRYEFGKIIAKYYGLDDSFIDGSSSDEYIRPKDVSLDFKKSSKDLGFNFPNIRTMLNEIEGVKR